MRTRLPRLPTLAEFLTAAESQGCAVGVIRERIVVENLETKVSAVIPPMNKSDYLTQFMTEFLCRTLGMTGFTSGGLKTAAIGLDADDRRRNLRSGRFQASTAIWRGCA
jgi:hypothetical protein